MNLTSGLLACSLPLLLSAGEIPDASIPAGVGVNIHFVNGHERDLDLIAAGGFKLVRMDFSWAGTEQKKDNYDWSGYDELTANLDQRRLRAIYILDYSNPLYEEAVESKNPITGEAHRTTASPQHPESVAAYARWAAAAARHFQDRHVLWEIWNEPNIDFWSPKPEVQQYTTLALAAAKAIREAEPKATIIGPASSGFPWEFLEAFLKSGVLKYLDGVSVHPYREYRRSPETASADYQRLRDLIARFAPPGNKDRLPILSGEWGYATHNRGVSLATQAAFVARQQLVNLLNGVPLSIWYDWKNDGPDAAEREHNFGVVKSDLTPKPAYVAVQTLTQELAGFQVSRRLPLPSDQDYLLLFTNGAGEQALAAWTTAEPHSITVDRTLNEPGRLRMVAGDGQPLKAKLENGKLMLELSAAPKYVRFGK